MSDGNNSNFLNQYSEEEESFDNNVILLDDSIGTSQKKDQGLRKKDDLPDFGNISNIEHNHTGLFSNKDEKYLTEMQDEITKANIEKKYHGVNSIDSIEVDKKDKKYSSQIAESEEIINSIKKNNNNINNMPASKGSLFGKGAASHKKQDHATDAIQEDPEEYELTDDVKEIAEWTKRKLKKYDEKYPETESSKIQPETTTSTKPNQTKKITSKIPKEGYTKREPLFNQKTKHKREDEKNIEFNNKIKKKIESRKKGNPTSNIESKTYVQLAKEKEVYYKNVNNKKPKTTMPKKKVGVNK